MTRKCFKRAGWKSHQDKLDPRRLIFIDETWIKTNMGPLRGWGLRGQRLGARVPTYSPELNSIQQLFAKL